MAQYETYRRPILSSDTNDEGSNPPHGEVEFDDAKEWHIMCVLRGPIQTRLRTDYAKILKPLEATGKNLTVHDPNQTQLVIVAQDGNAFALPFAPFRQEHCPHKEFNDFPVIPGDFSPVELQNFLHELGAFDGNPSEFELQRLRKQGLGSHHTYSHKAA